MEKPTNTPPIPSWDLLQETRSAAHPPVTEIHKEHDDDMDRPQQDDRDDRADHGECDKPAERDGELYHQEHGR